MSGSLGSLSVELELTDEGFTTRINGAAQAMQVLQTNVQNTTTTINQFSNNIGGGLGHLTSWTIALGEAAHALSFLKEATIGWVEKIVESNAEIQRMTILMEGLSTQTNKASKFEDAKKNITELIDMAGKVPFSLSALNDTFIKLKTGGIDPMSGSMKNLTDAIAAFGGDDSRLQRAGYALQEMAGRGTISLSNLRRQLGQDIPGAVQAMAQSMFLTIPQMDELITKGMLSSKGAIDSMLGEMGRLYGGAAQAQINTYRGQVNQLTTTIQKLMMVAAGTNEGGQSVGGGFFETLVKTMKEINALFSGSGATAYAVTLNLTLTDLLTKVVSVGKAMIEWGGVITKVAEALAALALASAVGRVVSMLAGAFTSLGATMVAGVGGVRNFVTVIVELLGAGPAALTWVGRFASSVGVAAAEMAGCTIAAGSLEAVLGGLAVAFATIAVPVAIIAGAALIINHLMRMEHQADLTGEALKRVRLGDVTEANEAKARQEIADTEAYLKRLERIQKQLTDVQNGTEAAQRLGKGARLDDIPSIADMPAVDAPKTFFGANVVATAANKDSADIKKYGEDLNRTIAAVRKMLTDSFGAVERAPEVRMRQQAKGYVDQAAEKLQQVMDEARTVYAVETAKLEEQRTVATAHNDQAGVQGVNQGRVASATREYDMIINAYRKMLADETTLLLKADNEQNVIQRASSAALIEYLKTNLAEQEHLKEEGLKSLGRPSTDSSAKDTERATQLATTQIEHMREQIASINGEMENTGKTISKIMAEIGGRAHFDLLPANIKKDLEDVATELDKTAAAKKLFDAAMRASTQIDNTLSKATADLEFYRAKLNDPSIPSAQRAFYEATAKMGSSLAALSRSFAASENMAQAWSRGIALAAETAKAALAAARMQQAETMAQAETDIKAANERMIAAMPRAQRAAAQARERTEQLNKDVAAVNRDMAAGDPERARMLSQLEEAKHHVMDTESLIDARGAKGGGAAKKAENEMTGLMEKVAQLKQEIAGLNGEEAKWTVLLTRNGTLNTAKGQQILAQAKEVGVLEDALKKARAAQAALDELKTHGTNAAEALADYTALQQRGKMLEIEKEIFDYRQKQQHDVDKVGAQLNVPGIDQIQAAKQLAEAQAQARKDMTDTTSLDILKQMDAYKDATAKMNATDADTLAKKRALATQEIEMEKQKMDAIIQASNLTAQQKIAAEQTVVDHMKAQLDDLDRKDEDFLGRAIKSWGDWQSQLDKFGGEALSKFGDELGTMLSGGKAKWTDFADWAIKQLAKIAMEATASSALKSLGLGGSGMSGLFSSVVSGIGGMLGFGPNWSATGGETGLDTAGNAISETSSVVVHSGGMIGMDAPAMRSISSAVFDGAQRFHGGGLPGLKSDEVPAILQQGEAVFTKNQLDAIGSLNHNYGFVQSALSSVAKSANAMATAAPSGIASTPYDPSTAAAGSSLGAGAPAQSGSPVHFNLTNQTSQPVSATSAAPRFDGEKMVLDVVLKASQNPGAFRSGMKGAFGS